MDGLDVWVGWSRSKGQAVTLALAMPPPAASAPASVGASTLGSATAASVSATTPGTTGFCQCFDAWHVNQCPDAWARRHRKRTEAIAAVKRSPEYQMFCKCSQEHQDSCRLRLRLDEPDPCDRSMSKRAWEAAVQRWRFDLRLADLRLAREISV